MNGPIWFSEENVRECLTLNQAIEALKRAYIDLSFGQAHIVQKTLASWDGGSMHALGAVSHRASLGCFKTWINTPAGASAVLQLFDSESGQLLAMMKAGLLGAMRTSGICAVATDEFASDDADDLALVGAGRQAALQIAAISVVRPLKRVRVFSRSEARRAAFSAAMSRLFPFEIRPVSSLSECVEDAPIITTITRAETPFLEASLIQRGAHINAVGAILPGHAELRPELVEAAECLVVDDPEAANGSYELSMKRGLPREQSIQLTALSELLASPRQQLKRELTIFKPMGSGLSDLALADVIWRNRDKSASRQLEDGVIGAPRFEMKQTHS